MRPIVIDSGDAKKKLCGELGAEEFVDFKEHKDVAARVKEVADGVGAHGVLVTAYQAYKGQWRTCSTWFTLVPKLMMLVQMHFPSSATGSAARSCASHCRRLAQ